MAVSCQAAGSVPVAAQALALMVVGVTPTTCNRTLTAALFAVDGAGHGDLRFQRA